MEPVVQRISERIADLDPGRVRGLYLVGSAVVGGLRPDSDIDVLLVTEHHLDTGERQQLVDFLLRYSGSRATPQPGRPLELTSVALGDIVPWTYPPTCDFQYGEWLRADYESGALPARHLDPDLAVVLTSAAQYAQVLCGPAPAELLGIVPATDLRRSVHDSLPSLSAHLVGDERNVLLTLARMVITLRTGEIVAKDDAARRLLPDLQGRERSTVALALAGYLGEVSDDWSARTGDARLAANCLADLISGTADARWIVPEP